MCVCVCVYYIMNPTLCILGALCASVCVMFRNAEQSLHNVSESIRPCVFLRYCVSFALCCCESEEGDGGGGWRRYEVSGKREHFRGILSPTPPHCHPNPPSTPRKASTSAQSLQEMNAPSTKCMCVCVWVTRACTATMMFPMACAWHARSRCRRTMCVCVSSFNPEIYMRCISNKYDCCCCCCVCALCACLHARTRASAPAPTSANFWLGKRAVWGWRDW